MSTVGGGTRRGGLIAVAAREAGRVLASPLLVAMLAVLPVALTVWVLGIFAVPTPRDLPVAWVDQDDSTLSRALLRAVDATPSIALSIQAASPLDAEVLLRSGAAYGVVIVPRGFHSDLVRGEVPVVSCLYNGQTLLASGLIARDFRAGVAAVSAGLEVAAARARGAGGAGLEARVEPIVTRAHLLYNQQLNYHYYLVAALLPTFLQMLATMAMVVAVGQEFKSGTAAAWIAAGRGSPWRAVMGKALVYVTWFGLLAMGMLATIFGVLGTPARGSVAVLVAGAWLFVLACIALGFAIVVSFGSLRLGASAVALYTGVAFPFIGVTYPALAMPGPARAWRALIPLTHYVEVLLQQGVRGAGVAESVAPLAALAWFVVGASVVSAWPFWRLVRCHRAWRVE